jgi:hypothetical protein
VARTKKAVAPAEAEFERTSDTPSAEVETPAPSVHKTTINLTADAVADLKELATAKGTSVAEIIRRAIWMEKYLYTTIKNGGKVLVEEPDKTTRELVLR